jgi:hypothetical protein
MDESDAMFDTEMNAIQLPVEDDQNLENIM